MLNSVSLHLILTTIKAFASVPRCLAWELTGPESIYRAVLITKHSICHSPAWIMFNFTITSVQLSRHALEAGQRLAFSTFLCRRVPSDGMGSPERFRERFQQENFLLGIRMGWVVKYQPFQFCCLSKCQMSVIPHAHLPQTLSSSPMPRLVEREGSWQKCRVALDLPTTKECSIFQK